MSRPMPETKAMGPNSGNVFAALGLRDADELDTKVRLAVAMTRQLPARRLTQATAAAALSINQPKISALKHCKLEGFSLARLMTLGRRAMQRILIFGSFNFSSGRFQ